MKDVFLYKNFVFGVLFLSLMTLGERASAADQVATNSMSSFVELAVDTDSATSLELSFYCDRPGLVAKLIDSEDGPTLVYEAQNYNAFLTTLFESGKLAYEENGRNQSLTSGYYYLDTGWNYLFGQGWGRSHRISNPQQTFSGYRSLCDSAQRTADMESWGGDPTQPDETDWGTNVKLLSFIGPFVSYMTTAAGYSNGAAHGNASTTFNTYDMGQGGKADLLDLVEEEELVAALAKDSFLKSKAAEYDEEGLATLAKLAEEGHYRKLARYLNEVLSADCQVYYDTGRLSNFALYDYNKDEEKIAVRIGLSHGCGAARGHLTQLGLWLKLSEEYKWSLKKLLEEAVEKKSGLLMKDAG